MLTRAALAGAVFSTALLSYGVAVIDPTAFPERVDALTGTDVIALAPLSLGNPAAAAMLRPHEPPAPDATAPAPPPLITHTLAVGPGDTLAKVLFRAGIDRQDAHGAIAAMKAHFNPRRIRVGQDVVVAFQATLPGVDTAENKLPGRFAGIRYAPDYRREVRVLRTDDGRFHAETIKRKVTRYASYAEGSIQSSLYVAGRKADIPAPVLVDLFRLYSWDVDFQRDIRTGDQFRVLFEHIINDRGERADSGDILSATLTLRGKPISVYRHIGSKGHVEYFNEKGESAQKALMRTPIDGARLSSRYGKRRHPVLGYTKMHRGVDFAASSGTPIYAAGNGSVTYAGRKGGYGKYVRIRHNGTYETAYAHMKGYGRGIRTGTRVRQGQVIGYVGTTGRSTGPHLHYEIMMSGRQVNPLRVRMPSGRKLKGKELAHFMTEKARIDKLALRQALAFLSENAQ